MNREGNTRGFTLVELMLAMGFVSALLLAVAIIVIFIGNIYNKGITYKDVDQAGNSIAVELKRSISLSSPFDLTANYIQQTAAGQRVGGRLCTGKYSYVWNYGSMLNPTLNSNRNSPVSGKEIHFVKVYDPNYKYCRLSGGVYPPVIASDKPVELIDAGQHNLAIHDFKVTSPVSAIDSTTGQRLYSVQFILGTNDQKALNLSDDACLAPSETSAYVGAEPDPDYCAINRFNIVVRAGNDYE